jgi:Holliday junction resolvase
LRTSRARRRGRRKPAERERDIVAAVKAYLDQVGAYYIRLVGGPMLRHGLPDLVICAGGRFIALELKSTGRKPTRKQLEELYAVNSAGGIGLWADSTAKALSALKDVING